MIRLSSLTLRRGTKVLLEQVDLILHRGQRVGIVGPNGAGKSSFFGLLRGELLPDAGDFEYPAGMVIASVRQETPALHASALDYVLDGDEELRMIQREVANPAHDGVTHGDWLGKFEAVDGYSAEARASKLLHGLGFSTNDLQRPVASFSGGWRMRLNLAQALMCRSDLLLLDEPTNHLDLDAVLWLENWLSSYPGTLLLISHDRDFLDATVTAIAHLANSNIDLYTGNYAEFEAQKAEKLAQQQQTYEKQQREAAHLQKYIDRFRAQATKARQAQSRIKALERMEMISAAHIDSPFDFSFRQPASSPNPLLRIELGAAGYGGNRLLDEINISIESGARIGLLGRNGAGKSTLVKLLADDIALAAGTKVEGHGLKIGYFAQHQLEYLRVDESPLWHMQKLDPKTREQELRNFLGGFNFHGEMATGPIAPFSGGEKARLALALIVWQRPNLLLLDEPTNHLDLEMRHALTLALQDYVGAMIVVSHDRHLLRATTDTFWLVEEGRVKPFDGDLDDYKRYREQGGQAVSPANGVVDNLTGAERKAQKRQEAEARQRLAGLRKPLEKELNKIDAKLAELGKQRAVVVDALGGEEIYSEAAKDKLRDAVRQKAELDSAIEALEMDWLELHTQLEALVA
ncbi:ATP-binding cassette domain-containing protein [Chitinimonas sp. BJB300]|uniref:ATP-binding cassette domain-containing protein n=1 Tax=Chitinimonas sp. BJB300 TaxID=1559339 RepID=UPI000C1205D8|nr:ATP-binding cassette domain-containing protein [Chitinimonas sp. BJB300]PHV13294.1 ABC transporter ATP-binding protein [Chitinimonas sp. BJB300]TSJ86001.1 ATP-binding cassette domain-containing protein [Chitinimonas sp. BJB300]